MQRSSKLRSGSATKGRRTQALNPQIHHQIQKAGQTQVISLKSLPRKKKQKKVVDESAAAAVLEEANSYNGPEGIPLKDESWRDFCKRRIPEVRANFPGKAMAVYFKIVSLEWRKNRLTQT